MDPFQDQFWERSWQIITMWNPGLDLVGGGHPVTHGGLGSGSLPQNVLTSGSREFHLADGFRYLLLMFTPHTLGDDPI